MEAWELEQTAERYGDTIYRIALQYTRCHADAEDVLQEVLIQRFRRQAPFETPEHERRWLVRTAVDRSRNVLRGGRRRRSLPLEEAGELQTLPQPSYRALYDAVLSLPRNHRLVVDLYYYEGYSTDEIAEIIGVRGATVRTWLRRARMKLKELLKEEWEDEQW